MASKPEPSAYAFGESAGFGLFAVCLAVSLIVHSVFAPLPSLSALFRPRPRAIPQIQRAAFSEIPVDLGSDPAPAKNVEPEVVPSPAPTEHSAAADVATDSIEKPRAPRAQPAKAQSTSGEKSQASGPRLDVGARASSNSSYLAGRTLVNDCSLSALIDITRVRTHPLAARLSTLLVEWQPLFAGPGFDPLSDVERLLVVGPELRASGRGLAVVQHHLDAAQIRNALARAAARDAAAATPDQERYYAQLSPELLLMAPDRASLRPMKDFALASPPEGAIGTLYVDAPSRALASLPLDFPASIHWLRGIISPNADTGIAVDIEAGDENDALAKRHARELTRSVLALKFKSRARLIDRALFEARGSVIVARLEVTSAQIGALLDVLSDLVKAPPEPPLPAEPEPEPEASASAEVQPEPPATPEAPRAVEALANDAGANKPESDAPIDAGK